MSGLSAVLASVGSGLGASMSIGTGLPGDRLEWAKRVAGTAGMGWNIARGRFAAGIRT